MKRNAESLAQSSNKFSMCYKTHCVILRCKAKGGVITEEYTPSPMKVIFWYPADTTATMDCRYMDPKF